MSGFKALKEKEKSLNEGTQDLSEALSNVTKTPMTPIKDKPMQPKQGSTEWFAEEIAPITGEFGGVVGDDGTCKTAVVFDSIPKGHSCLVIDFDGGGAKLRDAFYQDRRSEFKCQNPWVMEGEARTAYNYPATHDKVMAIGRRALEWAQAQNDAEYEGERLHTVLVTAVDLWDSVASACMFIEDLGTAPDGIGAKISPHEKVGMRFNWQIRSTRFHQLTSLCRELTRHGVNVYYETHWNYEQTKEGTMTGNRKPRWEKQTANYLHTLLEMQSTSVRDDEGRLTGETRYEATFTKSRSRPDLLNKTRLVMTTYEDKNHKWNGLPELKGE
tara:strand:- start:3234 stop:4217 length:984 start_codon:yes stop_codon:yes gene_type:complete